jgi:hypothetical protein
LLFYERARGGAIAEIFPAAEMIQRAKKSRGGGRLGIK